MIISFKSSSNKPDSKFECNLWAEYVYLDDAEKNISQQKN